MNSPKWKIRPAIPSDISFIYSSWLKSYKHGNIANKQIKTSVFFENYREIIDSILENSTILVACLPEEDEVILGYLVFQSEKSVADYIFVKEAFRQEGIAKDLIISANLPPQFEYTHTTQALNKIKDKITNYTYNPFILYRR